MEDCTNGEDVCGNLKAISPADNNGSSDVADCVAELPLRLVKACVCVTLQHIITRHLEKSCHGCFVNHPSQFRHSCLFEPDSFYFQTHLVEIKRDLFKPPLIQSLTHCLRHYGFKANPLKLQGAVEAIVFELTVVPYICEHLQNFKHNNIDSSLAGVIFDSLKYWEDC